VLHLPNTLISLDEEVSGAGFDDMMAPHSGLALGLFGFADDHGLEGGAVAFDDFPTNSRKVTEGPTAGAANAFYDDFVVFIDVGERTIAGEKSRNLATVPNQLDAYSLPNCRVGLLRFDAYLLENDASSLGATLQRVGFDIKVEHASFEVPVLPAKLLPLLFEFPARKLANRRLGSSQPLFTSSQFQEAANQQRAIKLLPSAGSNAGLVPPSSR
jgi:hypothetical protein